MYPFVVFVGLALALAVIGEVLAELLPGSLNPRAHKALGTTLAVGIAILVAWALDWSVFRAFGQPLRDSWMNPVVTGVVLVGAGEFLRTIAGNLGLSLQIGRNKTA